MTLGNRSIRAYLTHLAAAVALPLVVLEVWNLHAAAEADSEAARDQVLHLARVTASEMVRFLDGVKDIASGLAARPAVRALDPASCDPILKDLLPLAPRFANVVTMDLEGRVICSAVPAAQPARGVPGRFLNRLRGPDQLTVGVAAPGVVTGRWVVPLGVPLVNAKGDVAGAVVLPLDLVRLPSPPSLEGLPANTVVGFVAADGTVLARSSESQRFVGMKLTDRIALQQKTGTADVAGIDGVARLQGFVPVPGTDWIAIASIPASEVFAVVKMRMVKSALILVAILLAALLLAVRWSRAIRDPIAAVADTASKIAAGNLAARAPVAGATEIAEVATQFNRMLDSRQQAEAELRESEDRYRDLVESSHDLICTHDLEGHLLSVNEAAVRLTGYPREALLRMNMADLLTSGSRDLFAAYLREIQEQGVASGVMRIRTARGASRWWEYRNTLRTKGVGAPLVRGMAHDITERKQAEDALRASEAWFRTLADSTPVGIFIYQGEHMVYANRAAQALSGYAAAEALAMPFWDLAHPEHRELARERALARQAGAAVSDRYEMKITRKNGEERWIDFAAGKIQWKGRPAIIGTAIDITQRKQIEQESHKYWGQLRIVSRRLAEVEETERRNINRELHDRVGQNLGALNINLDLIRSKLPRESLDVVGARFDDTQALLEETAAQIRNIMADLHPPALEEYGLLAALRTYVESAGARFAVPISVQGEDLAPRPPRAAEMALFRVAQGALANAVAHAKARKIQVTLGATAERVTLTVSDDGVGFDATRGQSGRANWGLAIMRERAEAVGATFAIVSAPGRGTRVVVEIARAAA